MTGLKPPMKADGLARLTELIEHGQYAGGMNISHLDGFLTAAIITPQDFYVAEHLPIILGDCGKLLGLYFNSYEENELFELLEARASHIHRNLAMSYVSPLLIPDENDCATGGYWAVGFFDFVNGSELWQSVCHAHEGIKRLLSSLRELMANICLNEAGLESTEKNIKAYIENIILNMFIVLRKFYPDYQRDNLSVDDVISWYTKKELI